MFAHPVILTLNMAVFVEEKIYWHFEKMIHKSRRRRRIMCLPSKCLSDMSKTNAKHKTTQDPISGRWCDSDLPLYVDTAC